MKAAQRNLQGGLICKLMLYEFQLGYNVMETTNNIRCRKDEGAIDLSTETRWLKKFRSGCKNLDNQARSGRPKTFDFERSLQTLKDKSSE